MVRSGGRDDLARPRLVDEVCAWLNLVAQEGHEAPDYWASLASRYSDPIQEVLRQGCEHPSLHVRAFLLRQFAEVADPSLLRIAEDGIESTDEDLWIASTWFLVRHRSVCGVGVIDRVRREARDRFLSSRARVGFDVLRTIATVEDCPALRKVYDTWLVPVSVDLGNGISTPYLCKAPGHSVRTSVALLLAKLGDEKTRGEIAEAIRQEEDPQKRAWGLFLAVRTPGYNFSLPALETALDDQRMVPQPVAFGPDPCAPRVQWIEEYTRVCDYAVRILRAMDGEANEWPFAVLPADSFLYPVDSPARDAPDYVADVCAALTPIPDPRVARVVRGYSDEQIAYARKRVDHHEEERLSAITSGKAPVATAVACGVRDGDMATLSRASALAREALRLTCANAFGEVAAVGSFLERKDLLILPGGVGERAMRVHGKRWEAMKPTEYRIGARGVAVIVHATNLRDDLTMAQLRAVYGGEVGDWRVLAAVGAGAKRDTAIRRYGVRRPEAAVKMFEDRVLPLHKAAAMDRKLESAEAIAAIAGDPRGIAFIDLAAVPVEPEKAGIKVLSIRPVGESAKPVPPSRGAVNDGSYPLAEPIFLYVSPEASEAAKGFAAFLASHEADEALLEAGMIPPPVPEVKPELPFAAGEWTDLLASVDPKEHTVSGLWQRQGVVMVVDDVKNPKQPARLLLGLETKGSYQVRAKLSCPHVADGAAAGLVLPVGESQIAVGLSRSAAGAELVLERAARGGPSVRQTAALKRWEEGRDYTLEAIVLVRGTWARIEVKLDGEEMFTWQGQQSDISAPWPYRLKWPPPRPKPKEGEVVEPLPPAPLGVYATVPATVKEAAVRVEATSK